MIITYNKKNEQVLSIIKGLPLVWEENNQLLIEGGEHPLINDLTVLAWGLYKDKIIEQNDDEIGIPLPIYLAALELEPITAEDLPKSEHIGKLISVKPTQAKPAVVRRRFYGVNYDINCLVTQTIADMWQANTLQVNDYVLVSFIEEIPNTIERHIAIVTDKVYQSW